MKKKRIRRNNGYFCQVCDIQRSQETERMSSRNESIRERGQLFLVSGVAVGFVVRCPLTSMT